MTLLRYNAQQYLAKSLKASLIFEAKLTRSLLKLFREYSSTVYTVYMQVGLPYFPPTFKVSLRLLLRKHYEDVGKYFGRFHEEYLVAQTKSISSTYPQVREKIRPYFDQLADTRAELITSTTEKDLRSYLTKLLEKLQASQTFISSRELAKLLKDLLDKSAAERAATIAITETTLPAEKAKEAEIEAILADEFERDAERLLGSEATQDEVDAVKAMGFEAAYLGGYFEARKVWNAVIDDRTRPAHLAAVGQTVRAGEPFLVGGEAIMFPGLGSIANSIHCRCSVSYNM